MQELKCHDSFMLMNYYCEACGTVEKIWNSRDGVTPFMIDCAKCGEHMQHVNWNQDQRIPDYKPPKGSRYFAELTRDRAAELAKKRVDAFAGSEYELKPGTPEYTEMVESLTADFLGDCCSMDILTA